jgi:hypothetical protein
MEESHSPPVGTIVYKLASLRIISDLPLLGVAPCRDQGSTGDEIVIRRARIPDSLSSVDVAFSDGQCNERELLLKIPGVASYLVRGGNEIFVDQADDSTDGDVCAYLLGSIFGVLCHQRGIPPLHASAVDVAGGCVAFIGASGAGKSTLGAALAGRGHQVIADDLCFLQFDEEGEVQVWPNVSRIRLWEDAMTNLGYVGPNVEPVWRGWSKYFIPLYPLRNPTEPRCLRRIYQISTASYGDSASVNRVYGAEAIEILMQNVYRLGLAEHMGYKPASFMLCATVARSVPVFRFNRPSGFDVLREGVELLEDHLRTDVSATLMAPARTKNS